MSSNLETATPNLLKHNAHQHSGTSKRPLNQHGLTSKSFSFNPNTSFNTSSSTATGSNSFNAGYLSSTSAYFSPNQSFFNHSVDTSTYSNPNRIVTEEEESDQQRALKQALDLKYFSGNKRPTTSTAQFAQFDQPRSLTTTTPTQQHPANAILQTFSQNGTCNSRSHLSSQHSDLSTEASKKLLNSSVRWITPIAQKPKQQELFALAQQYIHQKRFIIDLQIIAIVLVFATILSVGCSLLLNSEIFSTSFTLPKIIITLAISIATKVFSFKHKRELTFQFYAWIILGFLVDTLSTRIFLDIVVINFSNFIKSQMIELYFIMTLSVVCALEFYSNNGFIERRGDGSVNGEITSIITQSIRESVSKPLRILLTSLLVVLLSYIGVIFSSLKSGESLFEHFPQITITKLTLTLLYFSTVTITFFSLVSETLIQLKSYWRWNFLSLNHPAHLIQNFYFILADQTLSDENLEMKALQFWQANFNNSQRVNIKRTINFEGTPISVWEIFLRHTLRLKNRLAEFKEAHSSILALAEKTKKLRPTLPAAAFLYDAQNIKQIIKQNHAEMRLTYLLEVINIAFSNAVNTFIAFSNIPEYATIFQNTQTEENLSEFIESIVSDILELKSNTVLDQNNDLAYASKDLFSKIALLSESSNNNRLFTSATLQKLLSLSGSFYSQN